MTHHSRIAQGLYWDRAWSLVEGCSPASEGCVHCWSAAQAHMRQNHPNEKIRAANSGLTGPDGAFNGTVRLRSDLLTLPVRVKKPTVFSVWTDLFHESVPQIFIDEAFNIMSNCPQHTFLVLTKRDERMRNAMDSLEKRWNSVLFSPVITEPVWPLKNVWLGVTVESQEQTKLRIPYLMLASAAHRFISVEPMLERVDLENVEAMRFRDDLNYHINALQLDSKTANYFSGIGGEDCPFLDWVIVGPETGHNARSCEPAWIKNLHEQCRAAGVPFFDKSPTPMARELPWEVKK